MRHEYRFWVKGVDREDIEAKALIEASRYLGGRWEGAEITSIDVIVEQEIANAGGAVDYRLLTAAVTLRVRPK